MNENEQPKETKLDQIKKAMANEEIKTDPGATKVFNLAANLSKTVPNPTETPTDLIKEQIEKGKLLVGKGRLEVQPNTERPKEDKKVGELPPLPELPPIVIDGHEFRRTNIPHLDAMTVMMYIFSELAETNPTIASILDQVKFSFPDNAGNLIYPRVKKAKRKAKQPNDRPSEQTMQ